MNADNSNKKETWVNTIIESSTQLEEVDFPVHLSDKIFNKISAGENPTSASRIFILQAAAIIIILVTINVVSMIRFHQSSVSDSGDTENVFTTTYFDYLNN